MYPEHKNQPVFVWHRNDDAVQILADKKYNPRLLSELLTHENLKKFMADLRNAHMKDSYTAILSLLLFIYRWNHSCITF